MNFKKYLKALNGLFYGIADDGERHTVDEKELTILKAEDGKQFVKADEGLIEIEVEKRIEVDVKEPDTVQRALKQIQDMVISNSRSSTEIRGLAKAVEKLAANNNTGQREQWNKRSEFEADPAVLVNAKANEICDSIVPGVKIYKDRYGKIHEEAPNDPVSARLHEFQRRADQVYLVSVCNKNIALDKEGNIVNPNQVRALPIYKSFSQWAQNSGLGKALSTGTSGSGSEWIPVGYSPRLYEKARLMLKVAALFEVIPMTTNTLKPPVQTADATAYLIPENTADDGTKFTASTPTTSNFTLTSKKIAARIVVSDEADADSIVNMMDFTERNIAQAIANGIENAIINGDTTSPHQDSNVTSAVDVRKAWKGLRKLASDKSATITFSNADPTVTLMRTVLTTMGAPYAVKWPELAWVVSATSYLLLLSEMITKDNPQLMRLMPSGVSLIPGQIAEVFSSPMIVSEFQQSDLNASAVYDGSTTDRSTMQLVYRPGFVIGMRTAGVQISRIIDEETDQIKIVAKQRADFQDVYGSGEKSVASGINIDEA